MAKKRKFGKWVLLGSILVFVLIIAILLHLYLNVMPEKAIERELARIRARGEPVTLEELAPPEIPDAENAAKTYEQAFGLYYEPPEEKDRKLSDISGKDLASWSDEEIKAIREYVEKNEDCLPFIFEAASFKKCRFDINYTAGLGMQPPDLGKVRGCARLMARDALLKAKVGKIDEALESTWAGLRLGKAFLDEPILISQLMRIGVDSMMLSVLQKILDESDASPEILKRLLEELDIQESRAASTRALQGERCIQIDLFEAFTKGPAGFSQMLQRWGGAPPQAPVSAKGHGIVFGLARPFFRRDELFALSIMRRMIDLSKLPHHQVKPDLDKLQQDIRNPPFYCIFTKMLLPSLTRRHRVEAWHEAEIGLAQLALGLKIFKAEKGRYPDSLSELVPEILPELPKDPFTGKDFVYKRAGEGFLVYSLGENGKDEGGKWDDANPYQHDIPWRCKR